MKKLILFFFYLIFSNFSQAQTFELKDSIFLEFNHEITDFQTDDFNSIYYIRNFSELNKIDFKTQKRITYSNQTILENLNTQNILQITLNSGIFNILVLDNHLNLVQDPIQFPLDGSFLPTLTALVDNNYLWGFDPTLQRLVLWNYQEKKIHRQSVILSEKTEDSYFLDLIYASQNIYLLGSTKILQFDEFANLKSIIPFQKYDQLSQSGDFIYFSSDNNLFCLNLNSKEIISIPEIHDFDYFAVNKNFLFVLKNKVVYIYPLPNQV